MSEIMFRADVHRDPKVWREYKRQMTRLRELYGDTPPCPFCDDISSRVIVDSTETLNVVKNDFPYRTFDKFYVTEHLLATPRRHVGSLSDLTQQEADEYLAIVGAYHAKGYASVTASQTAGHRTVPAHVHTHLLRYGEEVTPPRRKTVY